MDGCQHCRPVFGWNRAFWSGFQNNRSCATCGRVSGWAGWGQRARHHQHHPHHHQHHHCHRHQHQHHQQHHQPMREERVRMEAMQILRMFPVLPRLVVVDLDYTLWPFACHLNHGLPSLHRDVKGILLALKDTGIHIAIASRSPTADIANKFLEILGIKLMFVAQEIFPSIEPKTEHFRRINWRTGVPFNSMLFFDDEYRNIQAASQMGVTSILVDNYGLHLGALRQGLTKFNHNSCSAGRWRQR